MSWEKLLMTRVIIALSKHFLSMYNVSNSLPMCRADGKLCLSFAEMLMVSMKCSRGKWETITCSGARRPS